jgi:hypothetical protein
VLAGSYTVARAAGPGGTACVSASADAWQLNPLQINSPDIFLCGRYNNVGIGTGSPVYKLHVNGSQAVEGNITGNGNFYLKGDQVSSGNLSLDGNLLVGGSATTGPLSAVTGSFSGAVSLGAGLTVAGHTGLSSLTANGNMVLNGNETLTGNLNVTGLTSLSNGTDNLLVLNRPDGAGKKVQVSFRRNGNEYWAIGSGAAGSGGVQANDFYIFGTNSYTIPFYISPTGKIGINTVAPSEHYALSVNGDIRSKRIKVETAWPDYVFAEGYRLMPLTELEEYIRLNRHLPEIPSEKSIESGGADVGELLKLQMQKIEELTLYIIQQQAEIDLLKKSINK